MIYAPVIIPTCNRYVHLKRCVESLSRNKYAKETVLYISVDRPPDDPRYQDGHEELKEYIGSIKGFKEVKTVIQEVNLSPMKNIDFLISWIERDGYDRYILTEDDNEFSPNFLEYMDKCLDRFKDDKRIFSISSAGELYVPVKSKKENIFYRADFSAYGCGRWIEKDKVIRLAYENGYLEEVLRSGKRWKLLFGRPGTYQSFALDLIGKWPALRDRNGKVQIIDTSINIYCIINDLYNIYPVKRKVRNWGNDGSGVNCGVMDYDPGKIEIDMDQDFELQEDLSEVERISRDNEKERKKRENRINLSMLQKVSIVEGRRIFRDDRKFERYLRFIRKLGGIIHGDFSR